MEKERNSETRDIPGEKKRETERSKILRMKRLKNRDIETRDRVETQREGEREIKRK